ncbi:MAG: YbjN domain-containing protein [Pseudomonadota bacterium]
MAGLRGLIVGLGLVLFTAFGAAAEERLSAAEISKILGDQGYAVQQYSAEMVAVVVGEQVILVGVDGLDGDVSYITYVPGLSLRELGFEFLNEFNNAVKFGRAYVDGDGDIAIQMDRNAVGGISAENILSDFDVFLLLVTKFLSDVSTGSIA